MLESARSGLSPHCQSTPVRDLGGMLSRSLGMPSRNNEWAAKYLEHTWYIGKRCCKSNGVFFKFIRPRLQISDPLLDKFPTSATFVCWKIRFKTEVCTCSQFPTEALLWIKEVELVDLVDKLRSSSSLRSISMPDFEVLDARIASALNKIIHNTQFKSNVS